MRVFLIGLPKTGTLSAITALERVGLKWRQRIRSKDYYRSAFLDVQDGDIVADDGHQNYWYWDFLYPGSKFILQVRDEDAWLSSLRRHMERHPVRTPERRLKLTAVLGAYEFSENFHRIYYRRHNAGVQEYFAKTNQLLVHRTGKDGYAELCEFLNVPVVSEAWPHGNKSDV